MSSTTESNIEVQVTLADVTKLYTESTYFPPVYALYPPEYINALCEDDIGEDIMIAIIKAYHEHGCINKPLSSYNPFPDLYKLKDIKQDLAICIRHFKNHTKDALQYVLDRINALHEEDDEDDYYEDDGY